MWHAVHFARMLTVCVAQPWGTSWAYSRTVTERPGAVCWSCCWHASSRCRTRGWVQTRGGVGKLDTENLRHSLWSSCNVTWSMFTTGSLHVCCFLQLDLDIISEALRQLMVRSHVGIRPPELRRNDNLCQSISYANCSAVSGVDLCQMFYLVWFAVFQFQVHAKAYYALVCDMIVYDLKPELRSVLKKFYVRVGNAFRITDVEWRTLCWKHFMWISTFRRAENSAMEVSE